MYLDLPGKRYAIQKSLTRRSAGIAKPHTDRKFYDGTAIYVIKPKTQLAVKVPTSQPHPATETFAGAPTHETPIGGNTILGRACEVHRISVGETCSWHGVRLHEEISEHLFGPKYNYTKVAVKLQLDVALPEEVFRNPLGVEIVTSAEVFDQIDFVLESYKDLADQAQQRDTPSRKDAPRQLPVRSGQP